MRMSYRDLTRDVDRTPSLSLDPEENAPPRMGAGSFGLVITRLDKMHLLATVPLQGVR